LFLTYKTESEYLRYTKICSLCAAEQLAIWHADLLVDVGQDRVKWTRWTT